MSENGRIKEKFLNSGFTFAAIVDFRVVWSSMYVFINFVWDEKEIALVIIYEALFERIFE